MEKMKVRLFDADYMAYSFKCHAGHEHVIPTANMSKGGHQWEFNGDLNKPTFKPSIKETAGTYVPGYKPHHDNLDFIKRHSYICHFVITNGMIEYCSDCTHEYARQKLELPDLI